MKRSILSYFPLVETKYLVAAGALGICCSMVLSPALGLQPEAPGTDGQAEVRTPRPGSSDRREILDALRAEVREQHQLDVVFVVDHLKVKGHWAYLHTFPQSKDGASKYEDISALMQRRDGAWRVVDMSGADAEDLQRSYPTAPPAIYLGF